MSTALITHPTQTKVQIRIQNSSHTQPSTINLNFLSSASQTCLCNDFRAVKERGSVRSRMNPWWFRRLKGHLSVFRWTVVLFCLVREEEKRNWRFATFMTHWFGCPRVNTSYEMLLTCTIGKHKQFSSGCATEKKKVEKYLGFDVPHCLAVLFQAIRIQHNSTQVTISLS